ncbi:alpha/beta hydrolase [Haliscomenobacter sp.]|uniref:alpha/beta hydrolase n=1 Tax=Haliscomenobacter sp. TaxID=2717303 RepID=UPI003594367F
MFKQLLLSICCISFSLCIHAAKVDTVEITSTFLQRKVKIAVVTPKGYQSGQATYPTLYLLHGGNGKFSDWLMAPPDKNLVHRIADEYNLIIVLPEGGAGGYYLDSPINPASQYESFITKEVVTKVDGTYRSIKEKTGRVICGLSMGGHGALYLATRNPQLFCAVGSMSGALDINTDQWDVTPERRKAIADRQVNVWPPKAENPAFYYNNSVVNMAEKIKTNGLPIKFDCGVDDFLISPNRELHRRLLYNKTPHEYTERPGAHTWEYWQNALPDHVQFFQKIWKGNGTLK